MFFASSFRSLRDVAAPTSPVNLIHIKDPATLLCLNHYGTFSDCGDLTIWTFREVGEEKGSLVEIQSQGYEEHLCLSRYAISLGSVFGMKSSSGSGTQLGRCRFRGTGRTVWKMYQEDNDVLTLRIPSDRWSKRGDRGKSLGRGADTGLAALVPSGSKSSLIVTPLSALQFIAVVPSTSTNLNHSTLDDETSSLLPLPPSLQEFGGWKCPKTKLILPNNLDGRLPGEHRSVLMGADVFSRTVFGISFMVYTVGWYVEANGARNDAELKSFLEFDANELATDESFFQAMVSPNAKYDRTLLIKLNLALKCEVMVAALVEELLVTPRNSQILKDASKDWRDRECKRELEVSFTWRAANNVLEIRTNGVLDSILTEPGIAQDVLTQFVSDDPVAPGAKMAFATNFPALLASKSSSSSKEVMAAAKPSPDRFEQIDVQSKTTTYVDWKAALFEDFQALEEGINKSKAWTRRSLPKKLTQFFASWSSKKSSNKWQIKVESMMSDKKKNNAEVLRETVLVAYLLVLALASTTHLSSFRKRTTKARALALS